MPDDSIPLSPAPDELAALARADMDQIANLLMDLQFSPKAPEATRLIESVRTTLTRVGITLEMLPHGQERRTLTARMTDLQSRFRSLREPSTNSSSFFLSER